MDKKKLLVVCGPTATGKTSLAVSLAKKFDAELVSCDSRQVYTGMDIVTGKELDSRETIEKLRLSATHNGSDYLLVPYLFQGVPLWMYDVVLPSQEFSVSQYEYLAGMVISNIQKNHKLPIVVGGTGLYVRSLLRPMDTISIAPDSALRKELSFLSRFELQEKLKQLDLNTWEKLNDSDRNNPRRLVRKIEINLSQKKLLKNNSKIDSNVLLIGLTAPLKKIYERIDIRVDERMKSGALDEVEKMQSLYGFDIPSMTGLGYREWREYFKQEKDSGFQNAIIQQWKFDEHAYAKRQMTWFRKEKNIHWFDIQDTNAFLKIESLVRGWYTKE
ncbi:tRNA dimethylallyltransferase [Candidatus Gottesmanbacteria bacterium]|nr:tRNA dimethylallyltransferase [Candidatus Gottesmanbacteria bacterium]